MSIRSRRSLAVVGLVIFICACAARNATADPVEDFYKGRTLRFVIGSEPGTEYDQWARLIARHMGRHLPGSPQIVAQNMPGAGQIIATNHLYNIAERDGSVFGMISRNLPYMVLIGDKNVRVDPLKFNWIGSPERARRVCAVHQRSAVKRAEDLATTEALIGGTGAGSGMSNGPILLSRLLGIKLKLVEGYRGSQAVMLAMERGEIDGICISYEGLRGPRPDWLANGTVRILFNLEAEPIPGTGAPSIYALTTTERQRRIIAMFNTGAELGRPIVAPPGVPADRVAALRSAFAATLDDPQLMADAARLNYDVGLVSGADMTQLVETLMRTPADIVEETERLTR